MGGEWLSAIGEARMGPAQTLGAMRNMDIQDKQNAISMERSKLEIDGMRADAAKRQKNQKWLGQHIDPFSTQLFKVMTPGQQKIMQDRYKPLLSPTGTMERGDAIRELDMFSKEIGNMKSFQEAAVVDLRQQSAEIEWNLKKADEKLQKDPGNPKLIAEKQALEAKRKQNSNSFGALGVKSENLKKVEEILGAMDKGRKDYIVSKYGYNLTPEQIPEKSKEYDDLEAEKKVASDEAEIEQAKKKAKATRTPRQKAFESLSDDEKKESLLKPDFVISLGNKLKQEDAVALQKQNRYLKSPKFRSDVQKDVMALNKDDWGIWDKNQKADALRVETDKRIRQTYPDAQYGKLGSAEGWYTKIENKWVLISPWNE